MLKIMFIRLSIHSSYQYFFSTYKMLGSKWGTGETAINNQRWPTANITQVTLFTIVVNITKERYRVPSGTGKSVGSKEGWWRGKRMLSWGKDLRAETRVGGAAQGKWERKQSGGGTAGLQAPGGKELGQSVCGGEEPREAAGGQPLLRSEPESNTKPLDPFILCMKTQPQKWSHFTKNTDGEILAEFPFYDSWSSGVFVGLFCFFYKSNLHPLTVNLES